MEEIKNQQPQNPQNGGRKRRHKKRKGGNPNHQNNQPQNQNQPKVAVEKALAQNNQNHQNNQNNQPKADKHKQKQKDGNNNQNQNGKQAKEENRKDTYAYMLDGNLYINLTNKCSNGCDFCVRNERSSYYGNYLWLHHGEPTADKVIAQVKGFGDIKRFKEAVFCGFGEPTYKVAEMVTLCDYFHEKGLATRLNTNGQGNMINKRDIVPELKGKIDLVNVSLNASCKEKYQKICRSQYGENGFEGMIEFAKACKKEGVPVRFSIVDCIGEEEVNACKKLCESINIPLYIRDYITDS